MISSERIADVIYKTVEEVNEQLPEEKRLEKSNETILFGLSGKLDSLGLVTLLAAIEQNIEDEFDISVTLADERAMSQRHSPFKTIGTLVDYIKMLIKEL